jgi:hypothetical protein
LAKVSAGAAVAVMTHVDFGLRALMLFGAAAGIRQHPIHKFPADAWGIVYGGGHPGCAEIGDFQGVDEVQ